MAYSESKNHNRFYLLVAAVWTVLIVLSLYRNVKSYQQHSIQLATSQARDFWNKDNAFREWATRHGGLYVRPDTRTPPNPLLSHLPHRDVTTTDGVNLTLMNPAYMMRQMTQEYAELYGVKGKITGQVLLDPDSKTNKPDAWELSALKQFDQGKKEIVAVELLDGARHLRLMRPMFMKPGCMLCHGHLGFKVDDIRGGVSVSVPLEPFEQADALSRKKASLTHGVIWFLGIMAIVYFAVMKQRQQQKEQQAKSLEEKNKKELADSQRHYQSLIETVAAIPWEMNFKTGQFTHIGQQAVSMLGFSIEQWRQKDFWCQHIHPDDVTKTLHEFRQQAIKGDDYFLKYRMIAEDGRVVWINHFINVIQKDNEPELLQGYMFDVTDQIRSEQQLRRSQKMEALGKLTGGIAHDYNNMLGIILGYADILKEKLKDRSDLTKYIDQINDAGQRNARLTKKLLAFSREKSSESEVVNLNEVINDIQPLLEKTLTASIQLNVECDNDLRDVEVDKDELTDVILNLTINAMHAMAKEGGLLTITTENIRLDKQTQQDTNLDSGDYVQMSFTDTGVGMDSNTLTRIFDPFFSTKGEKGTGLGLSQVYGFVKRISGDIQVVSEQGQGSCFTIYLPVCENDTVLQEQNNTAEATEDNTGHETILVVDDEEALRELMIEVLSQNNYKVLSASNGDRALDVLQRHHVDLMLSDVIMPGMNGFELASKVKQLYPNVIIQLVSGYNDQKNLSSVKNKELVNNMLHKPLNGGEVIKRIRNLLDD